MVTISRVDRLLERDAERETLLAMVERVRGGLGTVVLKELSDQMSSIRIFVLQLLVVALAVVSVALAIRQLGLTTAEDPFLLLRLFTVDNPPLPSFAGPTRFSARMRPPCASTICR